MLLFGAPFGRLHCVEHLLKIDVLLFLSFTAYDLRVIL